MDRMRIWVAVPVLLVMLAGCVINVHPNGPNGPNGPDGPGWQKAKVPNVVGMTAADAEQALLAAGLSVGSKTTGPTGPVGKVGRVASQDPKAGKHVAAGTAVDLVLYKLIAPPAKVHVPDLVGKTVAEAEQALAAVGLVLGSKTPGPIGLPAKVGHVASQSPAAGALVMHGTKVDVSLYRKKIVLQTKVKVPDVTGKTQAVAANILQAAGLKVGDLKFVLTLSAVLANKVKSQDPAANAMVNDGSKVDLVIYKLMMKKP